MSIDYSEFPEHLRKPEHHQKTKRREKREQSDRDSDIRKYVFARERNICRCCRCRPAESRHELQFRSLGGKVSRTNCVAVCGSGTTGCHGFLQRLRIAWGAASIRRAEDTLYFTPKDQTAAEWLKIPLGDQMVSAPMRELEDQ